MKMKCFSIGLLLLSLISISFAQNSSSNSSYLKNQFNTQEGKILPYRIMYPLHYKVGKQYPLIVFLHGSGERGNDNEKQLVHSSNFFADQSFQNKIPAIVVFPQCPEDAYWSNVERNESTRPFGLKFDYKKEIQWPLLAVKSLIDSLIEEKQIDEKRIYIGGLSMGGMGTFELVYRFPKIFAAAFPICGGGDAQSYNENIRNCSFYVFHGDADPFVDVNLSRNMVGKLVALGAKVQYKEYKEVNHNSWDNVFAEKTLIDWLYNKKLKP